MHPCDLCQIGERARWQEDALALCAAVWGCSCCCICVQTSARRCKRCTSAILAGAVSVLCWFLCGLNQHISRWPGATYFDVKVLLSKN